MRGKASPLGLILVSCVSALVTAFQNPPDRTVWSGGAGDVEDFAISPDGSVLTYVSPATRELHVRDLRTNHSRQLSRIAASGGEVVESAIAADNTVVAVASRVPGEGWGLRVLDVEPSTTAPRLLVNGEVVPLQWFSDGKRLLVATPTEQGYRIGIVNSVDRSGRSLTTVSRSSNPNLPFAALSPDNTLVAFDTHLKRPVRHRSLFIVPTAGGLEVPVLDDGHWNSVLGWSANGRSIVFFSDRTGTPGIWSVPVTAAGRAGDPRLLIPDFRGSPKGLTSRNELFFAQPTAAPAAQIHIADLDENGNSTGRERRYEPGEDALIRFPRWSADGKSFLYIAAHHPGASVSVRPAPPQQDAPRTFPLNLAQVVTLDWAPDQSSIVFKGTDFSFFTGVHLVNAMTGETRRIITGGAAYQPQFTSDGKAIQFFLLVRESGRQRWSYVERVLATDRQRVLHDDLRLLMSETGANYPAGRSSDGRFLFAVNPSNQPMSILFGLDTTTSTVRELFRVDGADAFNHNGGLTYAPDGRAVIATVPNRNGQQEIWWIPMDDRKPHKIALTAPQIAENIIAIHPNGRQIAFLAGRQVEQTMRLLPWYRYIGQPADFRLRELPTER